MKFQNSAIGATSLSGKSGGTVATINNTMRRKSNPRQPNSAGQMAVRARFASLSSGWNSLTEAQQDSWIKASKDFVFFKHGDAYTLAGNSLYQKLNNNLLRAGQAMISTAPLPGTFPDLSIANVTAVIDDGDPVATITTNQTIDLTGYTVICVGCHPVSAGKRSLSNLDIEIGICTWEDDHVIPSADFPEFFSDWVAGKRVELGLYLVNNTTGQATTTQTGQALIETI